MDNDLMIERLKKAGLCFDKGLSDIEIKEVERNSKKKAHRFAMRFLFFDLNIVQSANMGVERYLSPVSGRRTTIFFPLFSGRLAISVAA